MLADRITATKSIAENTARFRKTSAAFEGNCAISSSLDAEKNISKKDNANKREKSEFNCSKTNS
jgi:hypothetical protein